MAVDTATKRFSILGLFNPTLKHVIPSGTIDAGQRSTFLDLYSGITLSKVVDIWTKQDDSAASWSSQSDNSNIWTKQTDSSDGWTVQ